MSMPCGRLCAYRWPRLWLWGKLEAARGSRTDRRKAYGGPCGTRRGSAIVRAEQERVSAITSSPDAHGGTWEARSAGASHLLSWSMC